MPVDMIDAAVKAAASPEYVEFNVNVAAPGQPPIYAKVVLPKPVTEVSIFNLFASIATWWKQQYAKDHPLEAVGLVVASSVSMPEPPGRGG